MKTILCYGDSNTFGYNPENGGRYDENTRWSGILKSALKEKYIVIEKGLNNRTGFIDNPNGLNYNSMLHFPRIVQNMFVDILIFAIGTNDLQYIFDIDTKTLEKKLIEFINMAKAKSAQIVLIPPVIMTKEVCSGYFSCQFDNSSIEKAKEANRIYKKVASTTACKCFDFNEFTTPSKLDGLHYDKNSHLLIAQKLTEFINTNF